MLTKGRAGPNPAVQAWKEERTSWLCR